VGLRVSHHVQVETNYVSQCLMPGDTAVIVFAKLPLPGLVKTRLARSVGANAAARFSLRLPQGKCARTYLF